VQETTVTKKEVEVIRCSDFVSEHRIGHIDLMKIDVEGAEERILDDISGILPMIDAIVLEYHYARDFCSENSLSRIISALERARFIVSVEPTWFTRKPEVLCTYVVKAINGTSNCVVENNFPVAV
jgi:hypothetical protein